MRSDRKATEEREQRLQAKEAKKNRSGFSKFTKVWALVFLGINLVFGAMLFLANILATKYLVAAGLVVLLLLLIIFPPLYSYKTKKVQEDIIKLENSCRKNICTKKKGVVEDQYYRAYATLSYCRRIETAEALTLINWLRLGQNYIDTSDADLDWNKINKLTQKVRRNYSDSAVKGVRPKDRASARAAFIRDIMKGGQAS